MSPSLLTKDELRDLTGFSRATKQAIALAELNIPHRIRADGLPLVHRQTYETWLGVPKERQSPADKSVRLNLEALDTR